MSDDKEKGLGQSDECAVTMSVYLHAQEYIYMFTSVVFLVVKVAGKHLLPISIISVEYCKSATPQSFNRLVVIGLWWVFDESFP